MVSHNRIIWEQIMIPRLARLLASDLIHFPCNTTAFYTYGIRSVTTIHDLIFLNDRSPIWRPKAFVAENYIRFSFRYFAKRSGSIISVSKMTQALLMGKGIKSHAIYNTADGFISSHVISKKSATSRRYILHRGGSAAHRNTQRVIEAFRAARHVLPDVALKILGVPAEVAAKWRAPEEEDIQFLPRLSDDDLASLYSGSACVIVASLEEGFGLPIIEAFGFEVPVITSNIDPMKEIAGDAALLVNPLSIADISRAMVSVLLDEEVAQSLIAKGRIRLEHFASERIAQQLLAVYRGDDGMYALETKSVRR
jgi:glycosyltransferase involved in cell wall biosynthesis